VPKVARTSRATSQLIRQIAVLGLVFCAVALALAVPLRNYLAQRADLGVEISKQQQGETTLAARTQEQAALADPAYIASEAKRRLQYVKPGDTVYYVHAPALPGPTATAAPSVAPSVPWYSHLWDTLSDPTQTAAPGPPASSNSPTPAKVGR
jgi:cell division protein FtsB